MYVFRHLLVVSFLWILQPLPSIAQDVNEPDNTRATAKVVRINDTAPPIHTIHVSGDEDWVRFFALNSVRYQIAIINTGDPNLCLRLELYRGNDVDPIADALPFCPGSQSLISYLNTGADGLYFVRAFEDKLGGPVGTNASYRLEVSLPEAPKPGTVLGSTTSGGAPLSDVFVRTSLNGSDISLNGSFVMSTSAGTGTVTVTATKVGYQDAVIPGVPVTPGQPTPLDIEMQSINQPMPPVLSNLQIPFGTITQTSALATVSIVPNTVPATVVFSYGIAFPSNSLPGISVSADSTVEQSIASLDCGTTYAVRAVATNAAPGSSQLDSSFTTDACSPPTLTLDQPGTGLLAVTLTGSVVANGPDTNWVLRAGIVGQFPGQLDFGTASGTTPDLAQANLNLDCGMSYEVELEATRNGVSVGSLQRFFSSQLCDPIVTLDSVTVSPTNVAFDGSLSANGLGGNWEFRAGIFAPSAPVAPAAGVSDSFSGPISASIPVGNFECGRHYQAVAVFQRSGQATETVSTPVREFDAPPCAAPSVTLSDPGSPSGPSVLLQASVITDGNGGTGQFLFGELFSMQPIGAAQPFGATGTYPLSQSADIVCGRSYQFTLQVIPASGPAFDATPQSFQSAACPPMTSDLSVEHGNGLNTFLLSGDNWYLTEFRNLGPDAADSVNLDIPIPSGTTFISWSCTAFAGATCPFPTNGSGALDATLGSFPSGGYLQFMSRFTLPTSSTQTQVSTQAAISCPPPCTDPMNSNNNAVDVDPVVLMRSGFE
jgi:uncharacterized repeat protein (TIGR01451 family)